MSSVSLKTDLGNESLEEIRKSMILSIVKSAEQHPKTAYDLAICLYTMDAYQGALSILCKVNSKACDFLKLDIYYESRQYEKALSCTDILFEKYASDFEAVLDVMYTRAKCLWEFNKKEEARELLSKITSHDADFRDVQSLLFEWNKGVGG